MSAMDRYRYWVDVQSWGTERRPRFNAEVANFVATSGYVTPGRVTALATDFAAMTDTQRQVLAQENLHYRYIEKGHKLVQTMMDNGHWDPARGDVASGAPGRPLDNVKSNGYRAVSTRVIRTGNSPSET